MNDFNDAEIEISDWKIAYGQSELEYEIDGDYAAVRVINATPTRCGIGTLIYAKFEEMAMLAGCKLIEVPSSLTAEAVCFWRAMGFDVQDKQDRRKMNYVIRYDREPKDEMQGVLVLEKRLA